MKKSWVIGIFISIFAILLISFVSAQSSGFLGVQTEKLVGIVQDFFGPIFAALLMGDYSGFLFERVLFFLIVLSLVYVGTSRFPAFKDKSAIIWTITICVSILSVRYIPDIPGVSFITLQYTVLGISLLSIIPFIIYLFFIESFESGAVRRFGWALYAVLYFTMWYLEFDSLGDLGYVYLFAALLGIIMLLADPYIRGIILRGFLKRGLDVELTTKLIDLREKIAKGYERRAATTNEREKADMDQYIKNLEHNFKRLSQLRGR